MGHPRAPEPVKLIAGILVTNIPLLRETHDALMAAYGPLDAASEPYQWTESSYYSAEMGAEIWRQFVSFGICIEPGALTAIKLRTNALEARWQRATGRCVNLDPGYLSATKLVLASTKDAAHRIYLSEGVYAEATLRFENGIWQPYAYTYRDYASVSACEFFTRVRARYLAQRRADGSAPG